MKKLRETVKRVTEGYTAAEIAPMIAHSLGLKRGDKTHASSVRDELKSYGGWTSVTPDLLQALTGIGITVVGA